MWQLLGIGADAERRMDFPIRLEFVKLALNNEALDGRA
jgi:hypothetical protein